MTNGREGWLEREVKDDEHKKCIEFLNGKKCEFCKQIFDDVLENKGICNMIENVPMLVFDEDIKQFGRERAIDYSRDEFQSYACGIARCKNMCKKHFKIITRDNDERYKRGLDIPNSLELLKFKRSFI